MIATCPLGGFPYVLPLSCVTYHMHRQVAYINKLMAADTALAGLVPDVLPNMLLHVILPSENPAGTSCRKTSPLDPP